MEETLIATETYLEEEVGFLLNEIITEKDKLRQLAAIEKGINAVYTNDETKRKFQVLAREVFKKFKALQPDKVLNEFAPRKNAIDLIYSRIENNIESADVSELIRRIQGIVDDSISNLVQEPSEGTHIIDLSTLNFELLEKYFLKTVHKNEAVQSLKDKIEKKLRAMVDRNPLRVDFYQRYQEIIDEYNRGKDTVTIEETFRKLIEFINTLSKEEIDTKREGLDEEQKAIFDLLRKPNLSVSDKNKIKEIAIELLDELKSDKLKVEHWAYKSLTAASVFNTVSKTLFEKLPYPTYESDEIDNKTQLVFAHLRSQYYGAGSSIYGGY